ncbi:MAG: response regulator transcription factor [Chloroflexi bacterium]|nr:response regulator transcription factor [Chloroflexota bacterium]
MSGQRILVVDDDQKAVEMVRIYLEREGYQVVPAYDGPSALELARTVEPDLVVLDLMLPGFSGLDICQTLRRESEVPIIMLTARSAEDDKQLGLDLGADDYVAKPFSPRELVARIGSVLRRPEQEAGKEHGERSFGPLRVSFPDRKVCVDGQPVALTPSEFRLVSVLVREPGRAFTHQALVDKALGPDVEGLEGNVDIHIENLRRKLGPRAGSLIKSVYRVGYKFEVS